MIESFTAKDIDASEGIEIFVERDLRRLWVKMPISTAYFDQNGPIMRLSREVCGDDAVCPFDIGGRLGVFAICAKDALEEWRKEIGLTVEKEDSEHGPQSV
jgi:hypothetical protein